MPITASIVSFDLYDLVFKTILQLQRCTGPTEGFWSGWGCLTGEFSHDFIISFLLPHIIILIFLFLSVKSLSRHHQGLSTLLSMAIYIFIVYSGWYPLFAKLTLLWLVMSIIFSTYMFVVGKLIPPTKTEQLAKVLDKKKKEKEEKNKQKQR